MDCFSSSSSSSSSLVYRLLSVVVLPLEKKKLQISFEFFFHSFCHTSPNGFNATKKTLIFAQFKLSSDFNLAKEEKKIEKEKEYKC